MASCARDSERNAILLTRLALFCVTVHGFGPYLSVVGPKFFQRCVREASQASDVGSISIARSKFPDDSLAFMPGRLETENGGCPPDLETLVTGVSVGAGTDKKVALCSAPC